MATAIQREKSLKGWPRKWKVELIQAENPDWRDLSDGWYDPPPDAITLDPWPAR